MNFDDFITTWTNKPVDFDGIYPNQCMDLMHEYVYDVLGLTDKKVLSASAAYQVYTTFGSIPGHDQFDQYPNTPTGVPQKGDIVFFGQQVGQFGHVCIFISGDVNGFTSFDANWPTGSLPHAQSHLYNGCIGWLRFKGPVVDVGALQAKIVQLEADKNGLYLDKVAQFKGISDARDILNKING